jgi:hypothetical protein
MPECPARRLGRFDEVRLGSLIAVRASIVAAQQHTLIKQYASMSSAQ